MANFVKHTECNDCGSSDARAIYDDGSSYCWSCSATVMSEEYKKEINQKEKVKIKTNTRKEERKVKMQNADDTDSNKKSKPVITEEQKKRIKEETTIQCKGFRGFSDETTKFFGVRHAWDDNENVIEQYYPCTQNGELVGYKVREVPKDFVSIGRSGSEVELFGQFRFTSGGKYVILTEGEADAMAAYQMMKEYHKSRGNDYETAVVSAMTGAQSKKQIARQYKFFDSFEQIIISYDDDNAGINAIPDLITILPKGKVKVMPMSYKDANKYLELGKSKEFVRDFYNAKRQVPVGVLPSGQIHDRILQQTAVQKVPFPPFMQELNEMFIGGMNLGHTINVAADTGIGKTTLVNEMVYYWLFNSPHKVGVVSMELDAGQYGEALLSRHLSRKLALIPDLSEKIEYLTSDRIKEQSNKLWYDENGDDRFFLLDNRDGTIEEIQDTVEELVVSCGCKVIVLDPLQDVLDGLSNEEQALFMKWAKSMIKSHGILFVFINHMRKSENSNEQDIMGSSTIIKSASANIILKRDKNAEDPIVRNTTYILVPKNRIYGLTGPAGGVYYENTTHTLHNLQKWLDENTTTQADIDAGKVDVTRLDF